MKTKCQPGYTISVDGVCIKNTRSRTPIRRSFRKGLVQSRTRDEQCCINRCDIINLNGQLVVEGYTHKFICDQCGCDGDNESSFEAWFSSCTTYSWGNQYPCGNYSAGNYYCQPGTYAKYECPEYPGEDMLAPPKPT